MDMTDACTVTGNTHFLCRGVVFMEGALLAARVQASHSIPLQVQQNVEKSKLFHK